MTTMLGSEEIGRFRRVVARRLGLHFEDSKAEFLDEVLRRRLGSTGQKLEEYLRILDTPHSEKEWAALAKDLTVNETYFFRHIDQFHAFSSVLPQRVRARAANKSLRILSAGCASGEETYTLSILVRQAGLDPSWRIAILGVDVNPQMIEAAERRRYSTWSLRETPEHIRQRWFREESAGIFELDEKAADGVRFAAKNLIEDDPSLWAAETYDMIFCRNMLMYLTPEHFRRVLDNLTRSLAGGGYLFLGHADNLRGHTNEFELQHTHNTFYYRRKDGSEESETRARTPEPLDSGEAWPETIRRSAVRIESLAGTAVPSGRQERRWDGVAVFELIRTERYREALEQIAALPPEYSADPAALLAHGAVLTHLGRFDEARKVCRTLLGIDFSNAGAHYILALCHEAGGNGVEAAAEDRIAIHLDPGFAMPHLRLGLLARQKGDRELARRELSRAVTLLRREEPSRLLLFGGGFTRDALIALCETRSDARGGNT